MHDGRFDPAFALLFAGDDSDCQDVKVPVPLSLLMAMSVMLSLGWLCAIALS